MSPVDLNGQTAEFHHWNCTDCTFSTRSLALALRHCEDASGDYPAPEHVLHELPSADDKVARNRARRVIACRDEDGRALNARVYRSGWRSIDGRWEIKGVTVGG